MVNNRKQDTSGKLTIQGVREPLLEPNKIGASTPYDFQGRNLTAYGGLLPVATILEKLGFQQLVGIRPANPPVRPRLDTCKAQAYICRRWRSDPACRCLPRSVARVGRGSRTLRPGCAGRCRSDGWMRPGHRDGRDTGAVGAILASSGARRETTGRPRRTSVARRAPPVPYQVHVKPNA